MKKKIACLFISLFMVLVLFSSNTVFAISNSYVQLHPSTGTTPTGVKVKVGDKINGYNIYQISGYDIYVDLGKYNVSLDSFRIPLPEEIWEGVAMQYTPQQTYVIAGTSGAVQKTPGASALLGNGGNTFYYYNLGSSSTSTTALWYFTLNFNANGGENAPNSLSYSTSSKYEKSHTFTIPSNIPTKSGYTFKGWSEESNSTTVKCNANGSYTLLQTVSGYNGGSISKTLYAVWEKDEEETIYTLNYDANDGTGIFAKETEKSNNESYTFIISSASPKREDYEFLGWADSKDATVGNYLANDHITLSKGSPTKTIYAVWKQEIQKYTVTYTDGVDGEEVFTDQIYSDLLSGVDTPAFDGTPKRDGYVFSGWNPEVATTVTEDATYTAVWKEDRNNNGIADDEEDKYTVTYTDGVDGETVFDDQVYSNLLSGDDTPAFDGTPKRDGYVFSGWNPEVATTVTEDATYTAVWKEDRNNNGVADDEEDKYTVTYTDGVDGETVFDDQVYSDLLSGDDTPAFEGTPKREGYKFLGWTPELSDKVTETVVYIATWEKINNNNGEEEPGNDVDDDGEKEPGNNVDDDGEKEPGNNVDDDGEKEPGNNVDDDGEKEPGNNVDDDGEKEPGNNVGDDGEKEPENNVSVDEKDNENNTVVTDNKTNNRDNQDKKEKVKTGDNSQIEIMIGALILSLSGLFLLRRRLKEN